MYSRVPIKGWENLYEIDTNGNVYNSLNGNMIIGDHNNCGYARVCLYNKFHNPPKQRFFRHRLVAEHFINNPNNYSQVNHKDFDKNNNTIENLEWCSPSQNEMHSRKFGNNKLNYVPIIVIYYDENNTLSIQKFESSVEVANLFNVSPGMVRHWVRGRSSSYINYGIIQIGEGDCIL